MGEWAGLSSTHDKHGRHVPKKDHWRLRGLRGLRKVGGGGRSADAAAGEGWWRFLAGRGLGLEPGTRAAWPRIGAREGG